MKKKELKSRLKMARRANLNLQDQLYERGPDKNIDWKERFEIAAAQRDEIATALHNLGQQHEVLKRQVSGIKEWNICVIEKRKPRLIGKEFGKTFAEACAQYFRNAPAEWWDKELGKYRGQKVVHRKLGTTLP